MKVFITLSLLLSIPLSGIAQTNYHLNKEASSLAILGTSSLHDWESVVEDFDIEIVTTQTDDSDFNINSLVFFAEVESIKSGKRIMDRKTRGALNHDDYPTIDFNFKEALATSTDSVTIIGLLSMAGVDQEVEVTGNLELSGTDLIISGEKKILMTEFGISPPTAMMGSLKTGDEVTIKFNIILNQQ